MVRSEVVVGVVFVMAVFLPTGASAQNMLINPDFDTDVTTGWSGLGVWDPMDAFGSPTSGSAMWINDFTGGGAHYLNQCIEIPGFTGGFDLSGWTYVPSGQASTGQSYLLAVFFSDPGCADPISVFQTSNFAGFDAWVRLMLIGWSPPESSSVEISLVNTKDQPGDYQVFHDAVFFGPNPDMVFGDGFETGDTSQWTSAVAGVE